MSLAEILDELPKLDTDDRALIQERLYQLNGVDPAPEPPEVLAALDAAIESLKVSPGVSVDEARRRFAEWSAK